MRRQTLGLVVAAAACGGAGPSTTAPVTAAVKPIYVVIFTHIEDNTPAGVPGSAQYRQNYLTIRQRLIDMAGLARRYNVQWSLEPDWNILLAALQNEDAAATA